MTKPAAPSRDKRWAFLVYLAGDNSLSDEMVWSLQEMKRASTREEVQKALHVLAMFDPKGDRPRRYDILTPQRRPTNDVDGDLRSFTGAKTLYREPDVGRIVRERRAGKTESPSRGERVGALVEDFFTRGVAELPTTPHCAVVLSGHGGEALGDFLMDSDPPSAVSIPELGGILDRLRTSLGRPIDVVGIDSCQMSTIEVGYQVRGAARYLVASEGLVMNAGWPYHRVLEAAAAATEGAELARGIVDRYLDFYRDYEVAGVSTDIASTDLTAIEEVASGVRDLGHAMRESLALLAPDGLEEGVEASEFFTSHANDGTVEARALRDAIVLAHWSAQSYKCDRYVDLYDFCLQLSRFGASSKIDGSILETCERIRGAIERAVIRSGTTGAEFQHSHGLSVYFPWSSADYFPEYRGTSFAEDTGWAKFLEIYLGATMRMRRFQPDYLIPADPDSAVVLDRRGSGSVASPPRHRPLGSILHEERRDVDAGTRRDVDAGTRRDVDAGTRRGKACRSTMKNPPEGHYELPRRKET